MKTHKPFPIALLDLSARILINALLWAAALITLFPFCYLLCASLKISADMFSSFFLPPGDGWAGVAWDRLTLANFQKLLRELDFGRNLLNSVFLASVTSVLATLSCALGGYALAKFRFPGREFMTTFVLATLVLPGVLLLAPTYQLLYWLGLLDSYAGLILPGLAPAFGIYLFRQAVITSVPDPILESARIDGCGEWRIFFAIVMPLIRPMLGAFLLITFLATWNNFVGPQIVLQSPEKFPLSVAIAQLRGVYQQDYGMLMAGTLVSVAPVMLLFLLLQQEFISGLTSGAVKE
jgi:ABC-type glycerol-3-phosphate transport system permease component